MLLKYTEFSTFFPPQKAFLIPQTDGFISLSDNRQPNRTKELCRKNPAELFQFYELNLFIEYQYDIVDGLPGIPWDFSHGLPETHWKIYWY